ncbi:MAG: threonine--tRNA ligase [Candidatus Schekmanbacteria bacterium GWA2_38_9]|uniref:Threonine--tRNA ligase n=1 Tax=Candidatus Schekmanbacteria bacterium RIFCSPLOWO2_12_FULL_38_15 TaxID=1817883 RepID=A0A1F7SFA9_9BACT|nr:MAG: threonine--tRNA ligase [Candidatus Schekmanbacteria bacterium GWA2_38_9]OGL50581.1 MAG: threonine--tRNA ligase [Candidatus Schekmanbacteria bacterium RIFCSPLOWO2_02_FULL_38_14]OGL52445.1 MAG: threonine--tRNA ligase [Candidatus Schekmanbacteria bacterium RIFCSPLOWO2_12_FULL_38_15]
MSQVQIALEDGRTHTVSSGKSVAEILSSINSKSLENIIACKVDGALEDLSYIVDKNISLETISKNSQEGLEILRHSTSHIMAQAVKELYPETKVAIGPAIENGFYYDFDRTTPFTPQDLEKIENKMEEIIRSGSAFKKNIFKKENAIKYFQSKGEIYKVELLEEIPQGEVTVYEQGSFTDLCRGPHIPKTSFVSSFKLLSVAGAYWRGNEKKQMLQRIYGISFFDSSELENYLKNLEEARKRDHRKIGKELELFSIHDEIGPGLVVYHPKGAMLRTMLEDFEKKEHLKRGYQIVIGPTLLKLDLWKQSGHYDNYREMMYFTEIEGQTYGIKPMNCISHMLIYKSKTRSYRDLPLRFFELGTVHRHEKSGVLHGLLRVRGFTQDDAHILCTPEQLQDEISGIIDFVDYVMRIFKFEYILELSTKPEKSIGSDEDWKRATNALVSALNKRGLGFETCVGEGAFYGPKIDIKLKDILGRLWQCATIQCDFALPERFDLSYTDHDGKPYRPVMLHRVILGSMERFLGILIEHFAGAFPTWLAPVQSRILTITNKVDQYGEKIKSLLINEGIRCEFDSRNEKISFKIREAQLQKIPYFLIVGKREEKEETVSVRLRDGRDLGSTPISEVIRMINNDITSKKLLPGGDIV